MNQRFNYKNFDYKKYVWFHWGIILLSSVFIHFQTKIFRNLKFRRQKRMRDLDESSTELSLAFDI
jgi:hypothetical protein